MASVSRRTLLVAGTVVAFSGCTDSVSDDHEDCEQLDTELADDDADGFANLFVRNEREDATTVELAVESQDSRRCSTVTLEPRQSETYPKAFDDETGYTLSVSVTSGPSLRDSHEWRPQNFDPRGVNVIVYADEIHFEDYQR